MQIMKNAIIEINCKLPQTFSFFFVSSDTRHKIIHNSFKYLKGKQSWHNNDKLSLVFIFVEAITVWKASRLRSSVSKCCRFEHVLIAGSTDGRLIHRDDKNTYWASADTHFPMKGALRKENKGIPWQGRSYSQRKATETNLCGKKN